ncbi:MAG: metallophosphoesterase [Halobacteriaceae archaeon]
MRVAVLSDLHGNWPALAAVERDLPDVDALLCAGDVVGYNPWPARCLEWLRKRSVPTVMGNHDRVVVRGSNFRGNPMARAGVTHARTCLDDDQVAWLADRPTALDAADGAIRVVHGHPDDPDRYTYPEEFGPDLLGEESVLVLGHTHVQHHEHTDEGVVLNPGSVGQPRDGDPRAAYATVDLETLSVTEHRVAYDVDRVADGVREAELPARTAERLREGR